ncbi:autotransporter assembly complex protein TamA [Thaumasiovibrio subtropicus]|uniref:autotransporter assembly complex protein TamA n=1 Tax=Thaumasiovibrio subtropicus TaxID=1891207 RepID=UPI000B34F787|nr:autotransporter assembly complex family protein [Thaumasiovibrio subtropicus]
MGWIRTTGLAMLIASAPALAEVEFEVKGLKGALRKNVELFLSAIDQDSIEDTDRFRSHLQSEISTAMRALGYYSPSYRVEWQADGDDTRVTLHMNAGPKTVIAERDIQLIGGGANDPDLLAVIENSRLDVGRTLNHGYYEAFKSSLSNTALKKGYFDARFEQSAMKVAPGRQQAFLVLHFDTGQRYHFGPTTINGSQIKEERVRSLMPFEEGDPYLASQLGEFNQALSNSQWFSSIFVEPRLEAAEDYKVPVHVELTPQNRNQVEVGLGYSTDVGARLKLNWKKPWVHSRGHSWNTNMEISAVQPKIETVYRIPLEDVLKDYYQIVGGLRYIDSHDTVSTELGFGVERHWLKESGWQRTLSLRYLYEDYKQGAEEEGLMELFIPGLTYSRTRARGGAMPSWGDKQFISMEYADPLLGSDTEIFRLRGRTGWVRSAGDRHRGLFKVDGGAVLADGIRHVPPSMRFFAGGDNSLRGYGYESIAPRDSGGQLRGGRFLMTATAEYQFRVYGNWWLAAFYDYGDAWNDKPDWNRGVGGGLRWASPVGPIRLDVGVGLDNDSDDYRIHFTLGPEF